MLAQLTLHTLCKVPLVRIGQLASQLIKVIRYFVQLNLNVAKENGDPNVYYDLLYDVDGSNSYTNVAVGNAAGNRSRHTGNEEVTQIPIILRKHLLLSFTPTISNATGVVRFKVNITQRAAGSRSLNRLTLQKQIIARVVLYFFYNFDGDCGVTHGIHRQIPNRNWRKVTLLLYSYGWRYLTVWRR